MNRTVRTALSLILIALPAAVPALGADAEVPPAYVPAGYDPKGMEEVEKAILAEQERLKKAKEEETAAFKKQQEEAFAAATKREKDGITVTLTDGEVKVTEPARVDDIDPVEIEQFRPWSLRAEDFRFDLPAEFYVRQAVGPDRIIGKDQAFLVLPFTVTNSLLHYDIKDPDGKLILSGAVNTEEELAAVRTKTEQDGNGFESVPATAELCLRFTVVTDKGNFTPEISGFLAHEAVDYSTFVRRAWTQDLLDFVSKNEVAGSLKPGETRAGVAVFPRFDPETTAVRIVVDGLAREHDFKRDLRKVLVLEFVRPGNVYYPNQVRLAYKRRVGNQLMDPKSGYLAGRDNDVHHGFDWAWIWTWAQAAQVEDPVRVADVPMPAGEGTMNFWLYKVKIPNRTGMEQEMTVDLVKTMASVDVDLQMVMEEGKAPENRKFTVEVPLVDDGRMNVYKAALFDKQGVPIGERFPKALKVPAGGENPTEFLVAFREADFDLDAVVLDIHNQLDLELAQARNKLAGRERDLFMRPRQLTTEEVESVRKQLVEKLPAALQEQLAKGVRAEITAKSGLSSGVKTINYSLRKPTPLPPAPEE